MSTKASSDVQLSADDERRYRSAMLANRMFGAFFEAVEQRRDTGTIASQKAFAERMGTSESNVSKLLAGPRNWRLNTIAEFLYALDLDLEFAFVDRADRNLIFTEVGERRRNWELEREIINLTSNAKYNHQLAILPEFHPTKIEGFSPKNYQGLTYVDAVNTRISPIAQTSNFAFRRIS